MPFSVETDSLANLVTRKMTHLDTQESTEVCQIVEWHKEVAMVMKHLPVAHNGVEPEWSEALCRGISVGVGVRFY